MKIEAVDFFYVSMPEVTAEADSSQDALLVRIVPGGHDALRPPSYRRGRDNASARMDGSIPLIRGAPELDGRKGPDF